MTTTERVTNFRVLNPITATTREIAEVLNRTINGGLNSVGYVTFPSNTTQTTVQDPRYSTSSLVFFTGVDHDPWHHNPYIDGTSVDGTMIINHDNQGHDARFAYLIIG
jgi:hypothetical protein